jgi:hypothetical protein
MRFTTFIVICLAHRIKSISQGAETSRMGHHKGEHDSNLAQWARLASPLHLKEEASPKEEDQAGYHARLEKITQEARRLVTRAVSPAIARLIKMVKKPAINKAAPKTTTSANVGYPHGYPS